MGQNLSWIAIVAVHSDRLDADDDVPSDVRSVFANLFHVSSLRLLYARHLQLFQSNTAVIYRIYGSLATEHTDDINRLLAQKTTKEAKLQPRVARFYAHLILVLKRMNKNPIKTLLTTCSVRRVNALR